MTFKTTKPRLGELQLRILKVLWDRGEASVADVHEAVTRGSALAYTTIATMLRKMEARALVAHREEGRSYIYHAKIREEAVSGGMADHLIDQLFGGRLSDLVSHLLSHREVSKEELARLEKVVAEHKRDGRKV